MARKGQKTSVGSNKSEIVRRLPIACADESAAVAFLEDTRWGGHPKCPECGKDNVYVMTDRATGERNRNNLLRCRDCNVQFSVRTGTVMAESRIPLRHWCYAFWAMSSSKKGVSALQIQRMTGLTYKSALFLCHRIREAMSDPNPAPLTGTVEADETYVGGKPRYKGTRKPGRGTSKAPVMVMVERGGKTRLRTLDRVTSMSLGRELMHNVDPTLTRLVTDECNPYKIAGKYFDGGHESVNHSHGQYVDGDIHSNTAESVFSLLKRGMIGTFHSVSRKHLARYCHEFEFRWNWRRVDDGERTRQAILNAQGKRLYYKQPVAG